MELQGEESQLGGHANPQEEILDGCRWGVVGYIKKYLLKSVTRHNLLCLISYINDHDAYVL